MSSQLDIILLDNLNDIIEEITIKRPESFKELNTILKNNFKNLPEKYAIFFPSSDNTTIEIHNEKDYKLSNDILFIHKIEPEDLNDSVFEINYHKLPEAKRELWDEKYTCSICSDFIKNEKPYYCYICQKIFHHKCLENWDNQRNFNQTLNCPICRKELPLSQWREKLDYEENRIKNGEILNELFQLKDDNTKKNEMNEKYKKYSEKITHLIKKILIQINKIHSLFHPNEKLNKLIKDFSLDFINPVIDDISKIILDELFELEKVIIINNINKNKEKQKIDNNSLQQIKNDIKNNNNNIEIINKEINDIEINDLEKNDYINVINLIYFNKNEEIKNIFGQKFVESNMNNIELIINGKKNPLINKYPLKKGVNHVKMLIKNKITHLEYMVQNCTSLQNIDELKNLNTKDITNFSHLFSGCSSLSDITSLKNWDVSNSNNFQFIFSGCSSLLDISSLDNWDVSNCKYFQSMFYQCKLLSDISPLRYWNVSKGKDFSFMFDGCTNLSDISPLKFWNISNGYSFQYFFCECKSLLNINSLENWDFSNCSNFSYMFYKCSNLSNISILKNWNVTNGKNFQSMFYKCISLSDISPLKEWNIKKGNNFENMFYGCSLISDKKPLYNWIFPLGSKINGMFDKCELLE